MENVSNISSEEELLQLRDEGKISETEYEELRETLRKTAKVDVGPSSQAKAEPTRTSGLAIASLVLSLVIPFGCIPAIVCGHIALRKIEKDAMIQGRGLALAGLIIGYVILGLFIVPTMLWVSYEGRAAPMEVVELKSFPLDNTDGLITQQGITIDKEISNDGKGSLRIEATETTTVRLFETGDIDIENARLFYRALLRTENLQGKAYLEMWCHFPGGGEYFSNGLHAALIGSTGTSWTIKEIPFILKKGQNPDNVKLNLVIEGRGTVWIDDIRLFKGQLR
ncbi:MAG: DUF4190 domain-containing protein [Planctomycetota bacterium]|jgi:hypothetical protein